MILATSKTFPKGIRVSHVINRDTWYDKWWLFVIGEGYVPMILAVKETNEDDAIDALVDHPIWHRELTEDVEPCQECQQADEIEQANREMGQETPYEAIRHLRDQCSCDFAGNNGIRVDLTRIKVLEECFELDMFAKPGKYGVY